MSNSVVLYSSCRHTLFLMICGGKFYCHVLYVEEVSFLKKKIAPLGVFRKKKTRKEKGNWVRIVLFCFVFEVPHFITTQWGSVCAMERHCYQATQTEQTQMQTGEAG